MIRHFVVPALIVAFGLSVLPAHAHATHTAKSHALHGGSQMPNLDANVSLYNLYVQSCNMDAQSFDFAQAAMQDATGDDDRQQAQAKLDQAHISLMQDVLKAVKLRKALEADRRLMKLYYYGDVLQIARAYPPNLTQSVRGKIVLRPLIAYPRVVVQH